MPPTRSHNSILDGSFPLSASRRSRLVCLFMPNGSHTHIVGRFIPAMLLEFDDLSNISASHKDILWRILPPTGSHNAKLDGLFLLSASRSSILVYLFKPNGSYTHIVGRFIPAILLEYDDFCTFLPAIRTSCKDYCPPLEAIIRYWLVDSRSLPAVGAYWCVYSCQMAAILT